MESFFKDDKDLFICFSYIINTKVTVDQAQHGAIESVHNSIEPVQYIPALTPESDSFISQSNMKRVINRSYLCFEADWVDMI